MSFKVRVCFFPFKHLTILLIRMSTYAVKACHCCSFILYVLSGSSFYSRINIFECSFSADALPVVV